MRITWDLLREAIRSYLQFAYPDRQLPEIVRARTTFDESRPVSEVIQSPPFENYASEAPFRCTVHSLRLGCVDYPHVKLEIRPYPNAAGFVFWVNTHDQFIAADARLPDAGPWRGLVGRNRELKQLVERAWAEKNLPTFTTTIDESPS